MPARACIFFFVLLGGAHCQGSPSAVEEPQVPMDPLLKEHYLALADSYEFMAEQASAATAAPSELADERPSLDKHTSEMYPHLALPAAGLPPNTPPTVGSGWAGAGWSGTPRYRKPNSDITQGGSPTYVAPPVAQQHHETKSSPKQYTLAILAQFKDEAHIMMEWIKHYRAHGVDHFFLIDNGSKDQWKAIVNPYVVEGLITVFSKTIPRRQVQHFNDVLPEVRPHCEWLMVVDLDEFIYAVPGHTIVGYLDSVGPKVQQIILPWKVYGSSGLTDQPKSVIHNFFHRKPVGPSPWPYKAIARMSGELQALSIHVHLYRPRWLQVMPTNPPTILTDGGHIDASAKAGKPESLPNLDENSIQSHILQLNHYQYQSHEWYLQNKAKKGGGVHEYYKPTEEDEKSAKFMLEHADKQCTIWDHDLSVHTSDEGGRM